MVKSTPLFEQGDIIMIDFNPSLGHEQKGHRPALIVSKKELQKKTGLVWVLPITSKIKKRPDEVELSSFCKTKGVLLFSQIKSMDLNIRNHYFVENVGEFYG